MSKASLAVLVMINFVLAGAVGFLAWEVQDLKLAADQKQHSENGGMLAQKKLEQEIKKTQDELKAQQDTLTEFSSTVATMTQELKKQLSNEFMPAPRVALSETIFIVKIIDETNVFVSGQKDSLEKWLNRNEFTLDYILSKSASIRPEYSKLIMDHIMTLSIFDQMGFKPGDVITAINGKATENPEDIYAQMITAEDATYGINRQGKKITLKVSFDSAAEAVVSVNISADQFKTLLPKLLTDLQIAPSMREGNPVGVKLVNVNMTNVFSLMKFQGGDVITSINGKPVTMTSFLANLESTKDLITFDFMRDEELKKITIKFM